MSTLKNKTLFISGASRGIGLAIAERAAKDGANVAVIGKTAEPHEKLPGTVYSACEAIEAAGASVLYLPPYSPDLSPIEPCWSKVKQFLRNAAARTAEALGAAITAALNTITRSDLLNCFRHCGYAIGPDCYTQP